MRTVIKKVKRVYVRILCALLFVTSFVGLAVSAETVEGQSGYYDFVKNGSFEEWGGIGLPGSWGAKGGTMGVEFLMEETDVYDGTKAARFKTETEGAWFTQTLHPLTPGNEYTFSGALKILNKDSAGSIKLTFYDVNGTSIKSVSTGFSDVAVNTWTVVSKVFTAPVGTAKTTLMVRITGTSGEILWDMVSVMGEGELPEEEDDETSPFVEMPDFAEEMLKNNSFEEGPAPVAYDWSPFGKSWVDNSYISVATDVARTGSRSLKITTTETNLPWGKQQIVSSTFEEGAVFQANFWYKGEVETVGCKFESYDAEGNPLGGSSAHKSGYTSGEWVQFCANYQPPCKGVAYVMFYVRIFAPGSAYFDDVSFYQIELAPDRPVALDTDEVFYYSDMETGIATAEADLVKHPELKNGYVDFTLKDDSETLLASATGQISEGVTTWNFDPRQMTVEGKDYKLTATIYDSDGSMVGSETDKISRYARPTMMAEDGTLIKDGKPFHPVFAYHVRASELVYMKEIGVNTTQSTAPLKDYLDAAQAQGIMVLARMYGNMKPAGHPDNYENTKRVVEELCDHPALLGWIVMDEPALHFPNAWDIFYDTYKLIRDIDKKHPITMTQNSVNDYERYGKYTDMVLIDPYPGTPDNLQKVGTYTMRAAKASHYQKSALCLNQAYLEGTYFPSIMEERNMWYEALMAGSTGNGFYCFYDAYTDAEGNVLDLNASPLWPGLVEFAKAEMNESYDVFLRQKYPIFNSYWGSDVLWTSYIKDNKINVIAVNRKNTQQAVSIPLVSDGGTVRVNGYTGVLKYGGSGTVSGEGETLNLTLAPNAALVYEITSSTALDFSDLYTTKFRDLQSYPWAAEQIRRLENKGIVVGKTAASFAPAEKITRGDFAMNLIRTLGLESDSTALFADVDADAYYAKEIAIGKAFGILKGTDGANFLPDEEISRQDLMVICARGMRLKRALEEGAPKTYLSGVSDDALVADYAVADVAALVRSNIVRGNVDGTIDPLSNTTRAEAAVLMDRILTWSTGKPEKDVLFDVAHLTDKEQGTVFNLAFSDGVWQSDTFWYATQKETDCTHYLLANGATEAETFTASVTGDAVTVLAGTNPTWVSFSNNVITMTVLPGEVVYCKVSTERTTGLYSNNVRWHTIPTTAYTLYSASNNGRAFIAVYAEQNGVKELLSIIMENEERPVEGDGDMKGMEWNVMEPCSEPYVLRKE